MLCNVLENLAPEILLGIALHIADLESLINLVQASPDVWRLLNSGCGGKILDQVLDSAPIDKDTKVVIRTIAYVRQDCLPVTTVSELQERVTNDSITHGHCRDGALGIEQVIGGYEPDEWFMQLDRIFSPAQLPKDCTPRTVRSILATYRRILSLTLGCLDSHLQRFQQSRPHCAADPDWEDEDAKLWNFREGILPSVPVPRQDLGPPTWFEEQAVFRGFWRVQFVNDLKSALASSSVCGWTDVQRHEFNAMNVLDVYDFVNLNYYIELASYGYSSGCLGVEIAEQSMILTAIDYLDEAPPITQSPPRASLWPAPQPSPRDQDNLADHWSEGFKRFDHVFKRFRLSTPALRHAYQRLGFPIWCAERLDGYGFNSGGPHLIEPGPNLLTWTSVLDEKAIAPAMEEQREIYARRGEHPYGPATADFISRVSQEIASLGGVFGMQGAVRGGRGRRRGMGRGQR